MSSKGSVLPLRSYFGEVRGEVSVTIDEMNEFLSEWSNATSTVFRARGLFSFATESYLYTL